MLRARVVALVGFLASTAACAGLGSNVLVTRIGAGLERRPKGCTLELLRDEPKRPYREIGRLASHIHDRTGIDPLDVLRDPACELGADAIIVTSEHETRAPGHHFVAGTAIVYLEPPPPPSPAPEEQQPTPPSERAPGTVDL